MSDLLKMEKKPVFCFTLESLVGSLKSSALKDAEREMVLSFLTSNHCKDDLFYMTGGSND